MRKIIILVDVYLPFVGGGQIWVKEISKYIAAKKNISIEIVTRKLKWNGIVAADSEILYDGKLKITRLGFVSSWNNIFSRLIFIIQAFFYLIFSDFDLIDAQVFVSAIPGKLAALIKRKPVILTVHGTSVEKKHHSFIEDFLLTKIKYDKVISVASNFLKIPNVNKNISVINPGVNLKFFKLDLIERKNNRIIFVGRLEKEKGIDILKKILFFYKQKDVEFAVVGEGSLKNDLMSYISSQKIRNACFLGVLSQEDLSKEYRRSGIFLMTSRTEGYPLTIIEAMASGLPIVASNVGDVGKIVSNIDNGFLVEDLRADSYIKYIDILLSNKSIQEKMGRANLNKSKNYSWQKTAESICQEYLEFI